jgi:hypothetical protein
MPEREPLDPLAALRAMSDIQRAGLEAAAAVVERMLELGRHGTRMPYSFHLPAEPVDGASGKGEAAGDGDGAEAAGEDGTAAGDPARALRRARADGERLLELWGEWMRLLLDAAADATEAGIAARNGNGAHPLAIGSARGGETASGRAWLHVLDGPPGPRARLTATALCSNDGNSIPAEAVGFDPPELETVDPRSSHQIAIDVNVPKATPVGVYHGHVLAKGLPEVALPILLEVIE